ncbi:DinB family protein [Actinomadura sp. K4S16]|uniref:DinB family protein n=1 Tax=Actinomadura sp. K4S16 TaxID=1316147 RepID=UPI0011EFFD78|nr:DinB family protein [Actinomadura sp. K4S16]
MAETSTPRQFSPRWNDDTRTTPPDVGDEREILSSVLDWQRETFELKCSGIPPQRLSDRAVPPSSLSLHGLLRHLAAAERWWFRIQFANEDVPLLYYSDDDPDQDFDTLDGDVHHALDTWRAECRRSRQIVATAASLEETGTRRRTGELVSLRRIMVDMIAEYARHNGHADLLRERIDGATGM